MKKNRFLFVLSIAIQPEQMTIEKFLMNITDKSKIINVLPEQLLIVHIAEV